MRAIHLIHPFERGVEIHFQSAVLKPHPSLDPRNAPSLAPIGSLNHETT